jgi:site-specific DNA-methyltransferase (cytosine-N4-specific)
MSIWDFIGKDTNELTHGIHLYPAKLNPHVARRLINQYGKNATNMLDPFCGSGTTLVEGRLAGINVVGNDINPTALEITRAKTQNYDYQDVEKLVREIKKSLPEMKLISLKKAIVIGGFTEEKIATWYTSRSVQEIASIFKMIDDLSSKLKSEVESKHLVKMTLSDCLRNVSVQRDAEWKLYRVEGWRKGLKDGSLYIPLMPLFRKKIESNLRSLKEYVEKLNISEKSSNSTYKIFKNDCSISIAQLSKNNQKFDLIVTSPPYGDSPTTVAYEQFSWLPNMWLGLDDRPPGKLAKEMLGGKLSQEIKPFGHKVIDLAIKRMKNDEIAVKNYTFYKDYLNSIINVAKVVKPGGYVCYVVGNRNSGKQNMRLDLFTRWAFEQNGFTRVGNIKKRKVPNTRMPKSNPSGPTMNHEYIVICRKN